MADCDPGEYLKRDEHNDICDRRHEAAMAWAHDAVDYSKDDRRNLWAKVTHIELSLAGMVKDNDEFVRKVGGYFVKGLIAIVCVMLFQVFILPKIAKNGEVSMLNAIDSKQTRQYKVSRTNDANIKVIMQKMGLPYQSPEELE